MRLFLLIYIAGLFYMMETVAQPTCYVPTFHFGSDGKDCYASFSKLLLPMMMMIKKETSCLNLFFIHLPLNMAWLFWDEVGCKESLEIGHTEYDMNFE